jgi:methylated-DNA-protein-cysteine methyltransferase-like protein
VSKAVPRILNPSASEPSDQALVERIYRVVSLVPRGTVATYGDVAAIVGAGCDARAVGYALNDLPKDRLATVPWQRIINAKGGISTRGQAQRRLLEAEGIIFDTRGLVELPRHRWGGPDAQQAAELGLHPLPARPDADRGGQLPLF